VGPVPEGVGVGVALKSGVGVGLGNGEIATVPNTIPCVKVPEYSLFICTVWFFARTVLFSNVCPGLTV
jgi:hypothetical protein